MNNGRCVQGQCGPEEGGVSSLVVRTGNKLSDPGEVGPGWAAHGVEGKSRLSRQRGPTCGKAWKCDVL